MPALTASSQTHVKHATALVRIPVGAFKHALGYDREVVLGDVVEAPKTAADASADLQRFMRGVCIHVCA